MATEFQWTRDVTRFVTAARSLLPMGQRLEFVRRILALPQSRPKSDPAGGPQAAARLPRHCRQMPFGCDCGREEGFRSVCVTALKALRRIEEINRRQARPKLLLVRTQKGRRLVVESPQNSSVVVQIYDSLLQDLRVQRQSVAFRASRLEEEAVAQMRSQLGQSRSPFNYVPHFLQALPPQQLKASRFQNAGASPWLDLDAGDSRKASKPTSEVALWKKKRVSRAAPLENEFEVELASERSMDDIRLSHSRRRSDRARAANLDTIQKDVRRTFQTERYFKNPPVLGVVQSLLESTSDKHSEIGYVQGMNFIIGGLIFHCPHQQQAAAILDFLFLNLELRKVFNFATFETHLGVTKTLLKCHLLEFYFFFDQVVNADFRLLLLDWFFCLGFNKVPLAESAALLSGLVRHGWFFFFRLLLCYFRAFEAKFSRKLLSFKSAQARFELEVELKNFYRAKLDWKGLLADALRFPLKDSLLEEQLGWTRRHLFQRPKSN